MPVSREPENQDKIKRGKTYSNIIRHTSAYKKNPLVCSRPRVKKYDQEYRGGHTVEVGHEV